MPSLQVQSHAMTEAQLRKELAPYKLEFIAKDLLKKVPNIGQLINGISGQDILAGLAFLHHEHPEMQRNVATMGIGAFKKFSAIRSDFLLEYERVSKESGFRMGEIQMAAKAFRHAMAKNGMDYLPESNSAKGLAQNHLDCDLSSFLFIQLGREKGLPLVGVTGNNHYLVGYGKGKITHYVETTDALGGVLPRKIDLHSNPALERAVELAELRSMEHHYVVSTEEWEKDNKNYEVLPANLSRHVSAWIGCRINDLETGSKLLGFIKDKGMYDEIRSLAKMNWETNKSDLTAFLSYYRILYRGSATFMFAGIDNEKELFSLYNEGKRIFGKKKLKESGVNMLQLTVKRATNPVDWYNSSD